MSRSLKKGAFTLPSLLVKIAKAKPGARIRTWSRPSVITPEMVGYIFEVHNGRKFIDVSVNENMVGHRLGEFSPTRKFQGHGGKMAKEQESVATAANAPAPAEKKDEKKK